MNQPPAFDEFQIQTNSKRKSTVRRRPKRKKNKTVYLAIGGGCAVIVTFALIVGFSVLSKSETTPVRQYVRDNISRDLEIVEIVEVADDTWNVKTYGEYLGTKTYIRFQVWKNSEGWHHQLGQF